MLLSFPNKMTPLIQTYRQRFCVDDGHVRDLEGMGS
jgi:hypothetical protein